MLKALRHLPSPLRCALLRHGLRFREESVRGLRAELATRPEDALAAARLVHDAYVKRELMDPHPTGVRVTPAQILPSSFVLVAKKGDEVIGTISLQVDGVLGLPIDNAYGKEVDAIRAQGRRVAEVGALTVHPEHRGTGVLHLLNQAMFQLAEKLGVHDLVIAVSAWAVDLYRTVLCFERMGEIFPYPGLARSIPSAALRLPLDTARERFRKLAPASFRVYVERAWPEVSLPASLDLHMHDEPRLEAVRALVSTRRDVFRTLDRFEVLALRQAVPSIYWPTPSQIDPRELESDGFVPAVPQEATT